MCQYDNGKGFGMKSIITYFVALAVCAMVFLLLDILLFNAQGLSFTFKG